MILNKAFAHLLDFGSKYLYKKELPDNYSFKVNNRNTRKRCGTMNCVYNVFDRYFYLRCIAISKEHLRPYI